MPLSSAQHGSHKPSLSMPPPLSIRLTEPVVFLRNSSGTFEGRPNEIRNTGQPALVRGLVTLFLTKPTRISSIEVTLEGKSSTVRLEGTASNTTRRGDNLAEKVFLTASSILYSAKSCPSSQRSASLGPLHPEDDYSLPNRPSVRSLSTQPHNTPHRNSAEYIRSLDASSQEHTMSVMLDSATSPPVSPLYTPQFTPQYSTMELPMISRPDTPIEYGDSSTHRSPFNTQESQSNLEASQDSPQAYAQDSVTGHHNHGSPSHSSRIGFLMPSPPISRSVSRDFIQSYNRDNSPSPGSSTPRGRHSSKWSLSSMTHIFKDAKEKFRSVSKESDLRRGRNPEPRQRQWDFDHDRMTADNTQNSNQTIHDTSHLDNWKEFRTYTYPISFTIPADCPPTISCPYGAVSYTLRGVVHRPGALTPKLTGSRDVMVVASPAEDDTEHTHSIAIERQWGTQLRYIISLGGRSVVIGSTIPFSLTLVPLDKCKIYRLSVFLEEKPSHRIPKGQTNRELPVKRVELLSIKHPHRADAPILPIDPDQADMLKPYVEISSSSISSDEAFASLMGPGPWVLSHTLRLPSDCSNLHFSFKHGYVNMTISHNLKIVFRIEKADDHTVESGTSKRRQFDIVVQMPLRILSCYCNTELSSLPRYTLASDNIGYPSNTVRHNSHSTGQSPYSMHVPSLSHYDHSHSSSIYEQSSTDFLHNAIQFSRLIAGQESTLGDAPPNYRDVVLD